MKKWMFVLFISMLVITGCSQSDEESDSNNGEVPAALEASLEVPESAEKDEEVPLTVVVTQGDEAVEDANEVKFEVWMEGKKEESEIIEAEHESDGKYVAAKTFTEDGVYMIQSHVTARSMHTMPQQQLTVGHVEAEHDHGDEGSDHSHAEDVKIELITSEGIKAEEETEMTVQILKEDKALADANVRLEVVQDSDEHNIAWVDMEEAKAGEYVTAHTFTASGKYIVVVHVENDEGLHEHVDVELTVE
ncbi:FixH family protein [Cytobacillus purgationiresistens]|uniref:YtkA-like domain-containing protein n=1 Tax=Cytobacillus purgationiresistens TaxID=863449 RepID=A0ABU0ANZ4_9BACI|nr:FixH family protein [Cytobacillus purgationiresistens]MDQ0273012.1 hypothetical protein [Cytobacillus purgationiresistens]